MGVVIRQSTYLKLGTGTHLSSKWLRIKASEFGLALFEPLADRFSNLSLA